MRKTMKFAFATLLGAVMMGGLPSVVLAQQDPSNQNIPSLTYESADVREALRALFHVVHVSYTIDPEVQGTVTVDLKDQTFETCLQAITRQVDATYRIEGGIFNIVKRETPPPATGPTDVPTNISSGKSYRVIQILHADPALIALLLGPMKGSQSYGGPPEITSLGRMRSGSQGGMGGGGGGGFGGGGSGGLGGGGGGGLGGGGGSFGGSSGGGGGFGGGGGGRGY